MMKIERKGDWGSHADFLDGRELTNNEPLIVRWPTGTYQQILITVEVTHGTVSDHGHENPTIQRTAYWMTTVATIPVRVPLLGLEAQRAL